LLIFCCLGTSHRTWYEKYGPNGSWTKAAAGTPLISTFFKPEKNENAASDVPPGQMGLTDFELSDDDQNEQQSQRVWDNAHVAEKALELRERLLDKNNLSAKDYLQFRAIYEYLVRLKAGGKGKMKASQEAASIVYMDAGPAQACKIRFLSTFWIENSTLPPSHQGKFQKTVRLIDDEGIAEACKAWIRTHGGKNGITPAQFKAFIETDFFPCHGISSHKTISTRTAERWLRVLGLTFKQHRKGIYYDGHEREDVVEYRKIFLQRMKAFEAKMTKYTGPHMDIEIEPLYWPWEKEIILVVHDESIFYSNDGKRGIWSEDGEMPLRAKGNGKSLMVSEFLSEACGRLSLTTAERFAHPDVPKDARVMLKPGKNAEGYWTAEHLMEQVEYRAIPIFEAKFPDAIGLFMFDNSSNHGAFLPDALVANRMNKGPGGKQPKMRKTFWGPNNVEQLLVWPDDHPDPKLRGQPKGIEQVLRERGLWKKMNLKCKLCMAKEKDDSRVDCCAVRVMSLQPDFLAQKPGLVEVIENAGHLCIFLPKFHCELNYIEMYWGAVKRFTREHCNYSWDELPDMVDLALDTVSLETIRRFARKSFRYMNLYRANVTGKLAEYACKKFKSHRRVPQDKLEHFLSQFQ
jgi:hypothetical protein